MRRRSPVLALVRGQRGVGATEYVILAITLVGVVLSLYAVTLHFAPVTSSICTFGPSLNCDKVNKSPWALLFGVPVAILGLLAYLFVLLVMLKRKPIQRRLAFTAKDFYLYLSFITLCMFGFQLYLTFVEMYIIHAYCVVCLASQVCTLLLSFFIGREAVVAK